MRAAERLGIINLWSAETPDSRADPLRIRIESHVIFCARQLAPANPVIAAIGPGEIELLSTPPSDPVNCFKVTVQTLQVSGQTALVDLTGGLSNLRAAIPPRKAGEPAIGQQVWVRLPLERLRLIPAPEH